MSSRPRHGPVGRTGVCWDNAVAYAVTRRSATSLPFLGSRTILNLGFDIPEVNDSGGDGSFCLQMSAEDITALDVDVLVWVISSDEALDGVLNRLPTRPALAAFAEGREVFAGCELTGAFSHASPLISDYALDQWVPEIEAAVDGDPATAVPSAVEAGAATPGPSSPAGGADDGGDEEAAAAEAWTLVFDSTVSFDDKARFMADVTALEGTVEAYNAAGESFGGIGLVPTEVVVNGLFAEVTYDVNFGENSAYSNQTGRATLVDGVWRVSRDEFCGFMSSARVSC
jgi:iron complex transport system substrate-binding protein